MATTKRRRAGSLRGLTTASRPGSAADRLDNLKADALKVGLLAATGSLIVGGFLLFKKSIHNAVAENRQETASERVSVTSSPEYWADRLRTAFNPSGMESLRSFDTTDVTGVMNVARGIRTQAQYVLVANAYQALTRRRLSDDMNNELSAQEGQEFRAILLRGCWLKKMRCNFEYGTPRLSHRFN